MSSTMRASNRSPYGVVVSCSSDELTAATGFEQVYQIAERELATAHDIVLMRAAEPWAMEYPVMAGHHSSSPYTPTGLLLYFGGDGCGALYVKPTDQPVELAGRFCPGYWAYVPAGVVFYFSVYAGEATYLQGVSVTART